MTLAVTPTRSLRSPGLDARIAQLVDERARHTTDWFGREASRIAQLCHALAQRFHQGGRLLAVGDSAAARSDARHVAVEFVHPVIVGKRALPALALTGTIDEIERDVTLLVEPHDMLFVFGSDARLGESITAARARGALTVAFADLAADWTFIPPGDDLFIRQELVETFYHVVWELVHVFFEHRGLLDDDGASINTTTIALGGISVADVTTSSATSFLYPFLANAERDLNGVLADVAASVAMKAAEITELRAATVGAVESPSRRELVDAARLLRAAFDTGHKLLAFGNGGSSTDAMDAVADYRSPPNGWRARPALDLSEDPAILTALANDVGPEVLFSRQIIAHGKAGDVALAFSTSGGSRNVIHALIEARKRGLATIAFVGYDGGRIADERLADCVVVSPSQHIPRVQEAQAAAHHIVRELVERLYDG
ncbi:MAG TPA: SIS domain-containing protein [Gemmatimonadaceae bacterium]